MLIYSIRLPDPRLSKPRLQARNNVRTERTLFVMTSCGYGEQGAIAMERMNKSVDKLIHGAALSWLLQVFADLQISMQS